MDNQTKSNVICLLERLTWGVDSVDGHKSIERLRKQVKAMRNLNEVKG